MSRPIVPTYLASAEFLEKKTGSGYRLAGWTLLRMLLIAPPMMVVGVPAKQAWIGAGIASGLISTLAVLRIFNAGQNGVGSLSGQRRTKMRRLRASCR